ncbi:GDP-mannose mannosyl hydrolase [Pigmentiphaga litoralis]|uniref:Colanic acid biosynthesis protein WcaH n=1 Tax=Pigmentiphaga litoralis TaxID=516702 RepID=A0A7Y9IQK0_9BURK|nr:NUDIX domain-containing protein [Pigmentiphaga litoralis]NYE25228.1 colanic acid biosynthesis protein WcaH [Pigmentiphaga litoralis]NYE81159.1 colanic acid biosynthesis protein WcaH [Pigmentiphaga litoralis]
MPIENVPLHRDRQPTLDRLDTPRFKAAVGSVPLVSIDLVVRCGDRYLLGLRTNQPAQNSWFVPGGRIRKNELIGEALRRLVEEELGLPHDHPPATPRGTYEHFYDTDFSGDMTASTHYVVLAYAMTLPDTGLELPVSQHSQYTWLERDAILARDDVHRYTKSYFLENP